MDAHRFSEPRTLCVLEGHCFLVSDGGDEWVLQDSSASVIEDVLVGRQIDRRIAHILRGGKSVTVFG